MQITTAGRSPDHGVTTRFHARGTLVACGVHAESRVPLHSCFFADSLTGTCRPYGLHVADAASPGKLQAARLGWAARTRPSRRGCSAADHRPTKAWSAAVAQQQRCRLARARGHGGHWHCCRKVRGCGCRPESPWPWQVRREHWWSPGGGGDGGSSSCCCASSM